MIKPSLFLASLTLLSHTLASAQVSFGPVAGFHLSGYYHRMSGTKLSHDGESRVPGLQIGAVADMIIDNRLHFQPALLFATKGYYWRASGSDVYMHYNINSIDLPLSLFYHFGMKHQSHFFVGAGVFASLNLGGYLTANGLAPGGGLLPDMTKRLVAGNDTPADMRPVSAGGALYAGYHLKNNIFIRVHYQRGLVNKTPARDSEKLFSANNNFGLTGGYLFRTRNKKERKERKAKPKPSY